MTAPRGTSGSVSFIQFPHPGGEHRMPASGRRGWKRGSDTHARSFLLADAEYRRTVDGPSEDGPVGFWGEWEGAAELVEELEPVEHGPRWLCRPNLAGPPPQSADGTPPQNTDPFVFGKRMQYTFCRQPGNSKLRRLGRGSLILFGSSPARGFELDTVLVVSSWFEHRRRSDLDGVADETYRRYTIDPMYGWKEDIDTFRLYLGATAADAVDGMFSFVPCRPAGDGVAFARPVIDLPDRLLRQNLRQQARVVAIDRHELGAVWQDVARQIEAAGLALATELRLPS